MDTPVQGICILVLPLDFFFIFSVCPLTFYAAFGEEWSNRSLMYIFLTVMGEVLVYPLSRTPIFLFSFPCSTPRFFISISESSFLVIRILRDHSRFGGFLLGFFFLGGGGVGVLWVFLCVFCFCFRSDCVAKV